MIAAGVLGVVALFALYFAFFRSSGSSTITATVKSSPTPKSTASPSANRTDSVLPTASEQDFYYQTTAVNYPGAISAPDPGRNIFAFYEPPMPCKGDQCPPSPIPSPSPIKTPPPPPPPPMLLAQVNPDNVYAGARAFRLEITGDKFTPEARIYFNQAELPTTFINSQRLAADIAAKHISTEGPRQVIIQTPDGKLYSNQVILNVQAPPKPTILYIGMIGRKRYNNDTAYLAENEKAAPFGARLNDVVGGRFRLIDISPAQVIFEDVNLGFKHRVPISKGILVGSMPPGRGSDLSEPPSVTYPPGFIPQQRIPGIPDNVRQISPEQKQEQQKKEAEKADVDDDG